MKFEFKPEDFKEALELGEAYHGHAADEIANAANAKLEAWLAAAPEVFGGKMESLGSKNYPDGAWRFHEDRNGYPWDITHRARLVDLEPLEPSP